MKGPPALPRRDAAHPSPAYRCLSRLVVPGALAVALTAGAGLAPSPAAADIGQDIAASQARLDELNRQAEAASERFNKGRIDLQASQDDVAAARESVAEQDAAVAGLRAQMGAFAAQAYRSGGGPSQLVLLTQAKSVQDVLDGWSKLDAVARHQDTVMAQLNRARAAQRQALHDAQVAADRAAQTLKALDADRQQVVVAATQGQQVLASLQAQQQQQIAAARDAAARQAAQQAANDLGGQAAAAAASLSAFRSESQAAAPAVVGAPAGSQAAAVAVRTALAQLGKPYVFGAAGPGSFDCSGLTMYAYAAAGVRLPHYTGSQFTQGRRVGYDELVPGDLVFFDGLGHEGMYIGNGQMVHAPHTGDVVRTVALAGYWQANFVGAVRLVG